MHTHRGGHILGYFKVCNTAVDLGKNQGLGFSRRLQFIPPSTKVNLILLFLNFPLQPTYWTVFPPLVHTHKHTPRYWPVVQQRWTESAILASDTEMAWAAMNHHPTSPERSYETGPNIFSATLRLNQRKAWNNPVRINTALGNSYTFLWGIWRWFGSAFLSHII
jgi:hypothetical protein